MPEIRIPPNQLDQIIELFRYLSFCDETHHFDDIVHSNFKQLQNENNLETLESDISNEEKRIIWRECRNTLQRLLLNFLENQELTEEHINLLTEIRVRLAEPIYDFRTEGRVLLQVREFARKNRYFEF